MLIVLASFVQEQIKIKVIVFLVILALLIGSLL